MFTVRLVMSAKSSVTSTVFVSFFLVLVLIHANLGLINVLCLTAVCRQHNWCRCDGSRSRSRRSNIAPIWKITKKKDPSAAWYVCRANKHDRCHCFCCARRSSVKTISRCCSTRHHHAAAEVVSVCSGQTASSRPDLVQSSRAGPRERTACVSVAATVVFLDPAAIARSEPW